MLHGLEKLHYYCFAHKVSMIIDHKQLVAIFKKDVVTLSHILQRVLLHLHRYNIRILYKPRPQLL